MNFNEDLRQKPLWQMTGEEFLCLYQNAGQQNVQQTAHHPAKKHVYGIFGISQLFGCSIPTAHRINP